MNLTKASAWVVACSAVVAMGGMSCGCSSDSSPAAVIDGGGSADGRPTSDSGNVPTGDGAGPAACSLLIKLISDPCTACAQAHCCAQINACFEDPKCKSFETCLLNCVSPPPDAGPDAAVSDAGGCEQDCNANTTKAATDEHNAWAPNCIAKKCVTECGL